MKTSFVKKFMVIALALAMVFTFAACGGSNDSGSGDDGGEAGAAVLKIGSSGPLTGGASIYGVAVKQGAEIAVAEINAQESDFQIEFKMEDDEADGEKSVNTYNQLKDWGIQIMMGTVTTGACITASALTFEDRVFELTPSASSADVTAGKDNVFQVCFTDPNQGIKAADYIAENFPGQKVGVIYNNSDPYSTGIFNNFKAEFESKGGEIAAAEKYPYMDIDRMGIYGCSAGGQNAMAAVLWHGDFYKAAYAACGCHDNRMDKIWWNEQWMGYPVDSSYVACSNVENAYRLERPLMLVVGEKDDNVDPASTMQVVAALEKAGKDFELVVIPGAGHTMGDDYGDHKRHDFFVRHLLGVEPPKWSELK